MLYFATVPAGLEPLAREALPRGAKLLHAGGGAALMELKTPPKAWPALYTNVFLVLCQAKTREFGALLRVAEATASTAFFAYTHPNQTFRVRFSQNGRLVNVAGAEMARAENLVKRAGRLRVNRVKSDWEFWYLLRQRSLWPVAFPPESAWGKGRAAS